MPALQTFIDQAWTDHADDAWAVSMRLPEALDLVTDADGLIELARLASHVYGEHLGRWADGLKYLAALARGPGFDATSPQGRQLRVLRAALALAGDAGDARGTLEPGERIQVTARAGMLLALHDAARAQALLDEAAADAAALADDDPAVRTLAVAGNNAAAALIDKAGRSDAERTLMLNAAALARRCWARAGSWLETERADYGLAMAWLAAGDAAQARLHAQACLALVDAQPAPPAFERFFACEALALAAAAQGDGAAQAQALAGARAAFDALTPEHQGACRAALQRLQNGAASGA
jgi:hypothetical protein